MKLNATGNWVITNSKGQFYNPRNGQWEDSFEPAKHFFHEWRKVLWHIYLGHGSGAKVEQVELNPSFTPVPVTQQELSEARVKMGW